MKPEIMTHDEAAAYLRYHPQHLYRLVLQKKGPVHRKGPGKKGKLTYYREDLDNWRHPVKGRNEK